MPDRCQLIRTAPVGGWPRNSGTPSGPSCWKWLSSCGRPSALTPAVERLTALTGGVCDSFERSADLVDDMADVRLSEVTVQRATENSGRRIAAQLGQGPQFVPARAWDWQKDVRGRAVAYFTVDATGTHQQGPGGRAAKGWAATLAALCEWDWPARPSARRWSGTSATTCTGWNTRSTKRRGGRSAAGSWKVRARRWWGSG